MPKATQLAKAQDKPMVLTWLSLPFPLEIPTSSGTSSVPTVAVPTAMPTQDAVDPLPLLRRPLAAEPTSGHCQAGTKSKESGLRQDQTDRSGPESPLHWTEASCKAARLRDDVHAVA